MKIGYYVYDIVWLIVMLLGFENLIVDEFGNDNLDYDY